MAAKKKNGMIGVEVEGLKDLQRALRKAKDKDTAKEIRKANKAAGQIVADEAKTVAPVASGKLAKSIGSQGGPSAAFVKAGTAKGVQYAGPIHFGWAARGIPARPFIYEAYDKRQDEVRAAYEKQLNKITEDLSTRRT